MRQTIEMGAYGFHQEALAPSERFLEVIRAILDMAVLGFCRRMATWPSPSTTATSPPRAARLTPQQHQSAAADGRGQAQQADRL